jgi:hypothetical protein
MRLYAEMLTQGGRDAMFASRNQLYECFFIYYLSPHFLSKLDEILKTKFHGESNKKGRQRGDLFLWRFIW